MFSQPSLKQPPAAGGLWGLLKCHISFRSTGSPAASVLTGTISELRIESESCILLQKGVWILMYRLFWLTWVSRRALFSVVERGNVFPCWFISNIKGRQWRSCSSKVLLLFSSLKVILSGINLSLLLTEYLEIVARSCSHDSVRRGKVMLWYYLELHLTWTSTVPCSLVTFIHQELLANWIQKVTP